MQKDYQEIERIIDSLSYHRENTPGTYSNIRYYTENEVRKALTTYGNARVEEIIKIAEGMKYKGEPSADASDLTWCGHHEHNNTLSDLIEAIKK